MNNLILSHQYISLAEKGTLPLKAIKKFAVNQLYIVFHDMKSLSVMLARSKDIVEFSFFKVLVDGDRHFYDLLLKFASELNLSEEDKRSLYDPRAIAYIHYLSWLALHASSGEVAVAMTINLPVWGSNTGRLVQALKDRYRLGETGFLEFFSQPTTELEQKAYPVIERYIDLSSYSMVAKTIQVLRRCLGRHTRSIYNAQYL